LALNNSVIFLLAFAVQHMIKSEEIKKQQLTFLKTKF